MQWTTIRRLPSSIHDHSAANKMPNEQTAVAVLLAGTMILAMLELEAWVIELLYTSQFSATPSILRWQILDDVLRVAAWLLDYVNFAHGDGCRYLVPESFEMSALVASIFFGLHSSESEASMIAFLMYLAYLPGGYFIAYREVGLTWALAIFWMTGLLVDIGTLISGFASLNTRFGASLGFITLVLFGFFRGQYFIHSKSHRTSYVACSWLSNAF